MSDIVMGKLEGVLGLAGRSKEGDVICEDFEAN